MVKLERFISEFLFSKSMKLFKTEEDFRDVLKFQDENELKEAIIDEKHLLVGNLYLGYKPDVNPSIFIGRCYLLEKPENFYWMHVRVGDGLCTARYTKEPDGKLRYRGIERIVLMR